MRTPGSPIAAHLRLGQAGEDLAASILRNRGYAILARNWRYRRLELDLICERRGTIVFVEVKTRSAAICGGGAGAITNAKKARLIKAAQAWLSINDMWSRPCRFDVVCLTAGDSETYRMEHYRNAFEFSAPLGSGNANWQPW